MPAITLIDDHDHRGDQGQLQGRQRQGRASPTSQNAVEPALGRFRDQGRDRDQDDQAQVRGDQATPERRRPRGAAMRPASGAPPLGLPELRASLRSHPQELLNDRASPGGDPQVAPRSWRRCRCSGSKNSAFTFSQPPRLAMSNRPGRADRELVLVLGEHRLVHRPVAAVRPQLLRLRRPQVREEVLCLGRGVGRGRGRRLDQDRVVGDRRSRRPRRPSGPRSRRSRRTAGRRPCRS